MTPFFAHISRNFPKSDTTYTRTCEFHARHLSVKCPKSHFFLDLKHGTLPPLSAIFHRMLRCIPRQSEKNFQGIYIFLSVQIEGVHVSMQFHVWSNQTRPVAIMPKRAGRVLMYPTMDIRLYEISRHQLSRESSVTCNFRHSVCAPAHQSSGRKLAKV